MAQDLMERVVRGGVAGALATLPMSGVMYASKRMGWMGRYPPEIITRRTLGAVGANESEDATETAAAVAHLGFGASAGAIYGAVAAGHHDIGAAVATGIAFGVAVYTVSYAGWIPAAHLLPPPPEDRPGRQPSMFAAHIVFGAVLGLLSQAGARRTGPRRL